MDDLDRRRLWWIRTNLPLRQWYSPVVWFWPVTRQQAIRGSRLLSLMTMTVVAVLVVGGIAIELSRS